MSNLEREPQETLCGGVATREPVRRILSPREVPLGGPRAIVVRRTLPHRELRTVGAWCFVDHFGQARLDAHGGMDLPPHPHTGLQTVTWLIEGEVLHRDTVGSEQLIRPGQLNLMTAGAGIAHAETSPPERSPFLHGVQLWVALPERSRHQEPHFEHHAQLPAVVDGGVTITVLMGALAGRASPAVTYSPLVGAEAVLGAGSRAEIPLDPGFEHAVLAVDGSPQIDRQPLPRGALLDLGYGRPHIEVAAVEPTRLLLLGGAPFEEQLVMWWNFVGRSHEEIVAAREDWEARRRFGDIPAYDGKRLPAPPIPDTPLRPRPSGRPAAS